LIPDRNQTSIQGFLGVKLNNAYLENDLLHKIVNEADLNEKTNLIVSDLNGRMLYGNKTEPGEMPGIRSYFNDNFPPWSIEIPDAPSEELFFEGIHKSFYFWTILFIIFILMFGVLLIMRIIAHEMDVLKLKSDFVSSVSHEFKTPITSISALTERLLAGKVNDPVRRKEYYSVIFEDANNLGRLVGNLLDFAKIEEGKKQYDFERTDIKEWLGQIVSNRQNELHEKGITFNSCISADIPLLAIDRNAMQLAINNLLDNAIKFSPGQVVVELIVESDKKNLFIKVKDNGIGIPKKELDKIFDKFYRGKSALKHSSTGTGLGLTLVRQIIEAHGGEVIVASELDKGSTFTLILPLSHN